MSSVPDVPRESTADRERVPTDRERARALARARLERARSEVSAGASPAFVASPAALLDGPAHVVVHGNGPFLAEFGEACLGLPAAESLLALPGVAFEVMRRVYVRGTPLACWLEISGERRRLTAAPRRDVETGEVYGVAVRLAGPGDATR
ncbi:MAG TPA: hypothetical protein VKR30_12420 [Candidatus Limnocylindrales bacterium]|nr:hypothetical protein [Candidatus Limnocylindrales bacterium]